MGINDFLFVKTVKTITGLSIKQVAYIPETLILEFLKNPEGERH